MVQTEGAGDWGFSHLGFVGRWFRLTGLGTGVLVIQGWWVGGLD